jgi:DNA processing protein
MPFGQNPAARFFPQRNRIIAVLSDGCLVIEAAFKSGTLITASQAAERNVPVMAIPGSPLEPRAQGCN